VSAADVRSRPEADIRDRLSRSASPWRKFQGRSKHAGQVRLNCVRLLWQVIERPPLLYVAALGQFELHGVETCSRLAVVASDVAAGVAAVEDCRVPGDPAR
jgi:hypothetical protein